MNLSAIAPALAGALIRWALTSLGVFIVAHGYLTADEYQTFAPALQEWLGGGVAVASLAWGAWQKHQAAQKTAAKEIVAVQTGTTTAERSGVPVTPAVQAKAVEIVAADIADKQGA
jgi:hypothetical protein